MKSNLQNMNEKEIQLILVLRLRIMINKIENVTEKEILLI
jgi:hypothetical protein